MKEEIKEELTLFEQQFIDTWFTVNFNGSLAYKRLKPHVTDGTATVEASKILTKPNVKDYIEEKRETVRKAQEITLEYIVGNLKDVIEDAKAEAELTDEEGRPLNRNDRKSILTALAQLSRLGGYDIKKVDITSKGESIKISFLE